MEEPQRRLAFSFEKFWTARVWPVLRWVLFIPVLCWIGRLVRRFLLMTGFAVMLVVFCFFLSAQIASGIDTLFPNFFDALLDTDQSLIVKLHEPGYFAEQTEVISEKRESVACISSAEHRVLIDDPADIPPLFMEAILASEDQTFFKHPGFEKWAVARAFFKQLLGMSTSGASTITMQLAKDLRHGMGHRSSVKQKIGDMIMSLRIEREFSSKLQILRLYVNTPYFGRGQYGIEAASSAYFGKPAKELALHQVAFIVSLINKPALPDRLSTRDKQAKTPDEIKRANWQMVLRGTRRVLTRMEEDGYITDIEYASASEAVDRTLNAQVLARGRSCGANDYFLEYIRVQYKDTLPLNKGGLTIPITRDDGLQDVLATVVKTTVKTYIDRHQNDPDNGELRAGAVVVQFNGDVLAEVGNIDFKKLKYDVMTQGLRQPGSAFKPFTYTGLVEYHTNQVLGENNPPETLEGIVAEVSRRCRVLDAPIGVSLGRGRGIKMIQNFRSNNPREKQYWGMMSCKEAVARSQNAAAVRAGQTAGMKNVISLMYDRLGMPKPKDARQICPPYPTSAIGACDVNPLGMSSLIALVNGGFKVTPRFMHDICKDGVSLLNKEEDGRGLDCDLRGERRPVQERVIHPAVAAVMTDILQGPLNDEFGTTKSLRRGVIPGMDILGSEIWKLKPDEKKARTLAFTLETSGEIAGKTGTATNADGKTSDVWLVLFIPGPPDRPEKGVMLVFWMGKDSKDHPLGDRGTGTNKGFAETGGRNWTHAAALVLSFLQKERGLLKPGHRFQPIYRDEVLSDFDAKKLTLGKETSTPNAESSTIVDPFDPNTPPELLKQFLELPQEDSSGEEGENKDPSVETSRD
ncbi:MAG: hypothetical protein A2942_02420 [Candidatus Lloydbacteria bacterium RIFCSPLOWO2_01_FULL_50_20]|uniref:peptidoglycan glycosyltransferase n=1 Tax=Candidatus Lloydbacteria bacterium RIFCSPLOWO2_01_FULL_50_20 TaxID=1798665 RepID=A0A1G2DBS2_9BACT|nr:MAG: hypothetical protein A3C13_00415 [Candidatus Lloydbacteria bacterium RIFCSPHIGHO2_02_FULL_50_11]OGZ11069.1 MAG: hypothetical protein A2942_02420 [Candidatus Lloydbacteria bacterium RIFCSPLOWO2_01_FULL_50_20]